MAGWNVQRLEYRFAELDPRSLRCSKKVITVAYSGDSPIAAVVTRRTVMVTGISPWAFPNIYVQKKYRRKGIGTMLFNEHWKFYKSLHPNVEDQPKVYNGIDGSEKFWHSVGLVVG